VPEAIIMGSGTSNGVPTLGKAYPPEFLANPKNHRTRSSLMLLGPTGNLLVDCPPELRLQVTGLGITQIDAVVITHAHADHVMGMDDLRSICIKTRRPVIVYTLERHAKDVRRIFDYAFREFPPEIMVPRFDMREMPDVLEIGGMTVRSFLVDHGDTPVIGLRVNGFAYITDVSYIPPAAEEMLQDLDYLVLDAVRYKPHPNHFDMAKAIEAARKIGAKQTYFTHLSDDYDHDKVNAELPNGMELAYDGLRLQI
jgi:phosphoribosyl 1,2-cyclic phosphate phosphodiesterase